KKSEGSHRQALKTIHLVTAPASSASPLLRHLRPDRERKKQQARAVLLERYEAVQRFVKQGLSHREISRRLHLHRESVKRFCQSRDLSRTDRTTNQPRYSVSLRNLLANPLGRRRAECGGLVPRMDSSR